MKKILAAAMALAITLLLVGCASKTYQITTKSGKTYTAKGALDYDVKSETYSFEGENGHQIILNQEDVEVIQEEN